MKVSEFQERFALELLTVKSYTDRDIKGCYIGDLLSWVMGRVDSGNVWITIMNNINIVAVAALTDVSCIVLCENVTADESVIQKANEENVIILKTNKTAYEIVSDFCGEI